MGLKLQALGANVQVSNSNYIVKAEKESGGHGEFIYSQIKQFIGFK